MFESFDRDGSGQIEKHEMYDFIARITGKQAKKKQPRKRSFKAKTRPATLSRDQSRGKSSQKSSSKKKIWK